MSADTALLETLVVAVFAAVTLQVLAKRLRVPAIALLLPAGILLGPEVLGVVQPKLLAEQMKVVIGLAVAVILFEGGLTLDVAGFRMAPQVIRRILSIGVAVTWIGTTLAIAGLYGYELEFAALAASLTVVTGPTVIGPILRRVHIRDRLHQILHWEGVLIDPIGVFIALGCYEWIVAEASLAPFASFAARMALGVVVGLAGGKLLVWVLQRRLIDDANANLFVFAAALLIFGVCDMVISESGLLGVTVAGLVLGLSNAPQLKEIKRFKLDLTKLSIGVLFILLAARLDLTIFTRLGATGLVLLALVMLVIRPLNVLVSTWRSPLDWRERAFLASLAPRGIVAASMASLVALLLVDLPSRAPHAWFLEAFTYAVIAGTVMVQGLGARLVARLLGVERPRRRTWLIVGARELGQDLAKQLQESGIPVILLDKNPDNVRRAWQAKLPAIEGDILSPTLFDDPRLYDVGTLLSVTGNTALDELACQRWHDAVEPGRAFRLPAPSDAGVEREPSDGEPGSPQLAALPEVGNALRADLALAQASRSNGSAETANGLSPRRLDP